MDDEAVGINNGISVIRVVICMMMICSYVPGLVGNVPVVVDVFNINGGQYTKNAMAQLNDVWEGNIHFLPNLRFFALI